MHSVDVVKLEKQRERERERERLCVVVSQMHK